MQAICLRDNADRRQSPPFFSKYMFGINGRRQNARREDDALQYVDRYEWPVALVAIGIVIMSALDATFTLKLLSMGAIELNAVMALLIEQDVARFVAFKLGLTTLSVLLLVIHKNHRLTGGIPVFRVAQLAFVGYATLIVYELWLFQLLA